MPDDEIKDIGSFARVTNMFVMGYGGALRKRLDDDADDIWDQMERERVALLERIHNERLVYIHTHGLPCGAD